MIAKILYNQDNPEQHKVIEFSEQLKKLKVDCQLIDADTADGTSLTELYGVASRPAVILIRDDGTLVQSWQYELPLADEVSYLAHT